MKKLSFVAMSALLVSVWSCKQETILTPEITEQKVEIFTPTADIEMEGEYLTFKNVEDFDQTITEINLSDKAAVNAWEESIGFVSQRNIFNQVVAAQDELDDYAESLSPTEQAKLRQEDEPESAILRQSLDKGLLKYITDHEDGSVYWDYAAVNVSVTPVINEQGLVKIAEKLYVYTNDRFLKIINDGDISKLEEVSKINEEIDNKDFSIIDVVGVSKNYHFDFSKTNSWRYPENGRRVKVSIEGQSDAYLVASSGSCIGKSYGVTCKFRIRNQAQRKNFWGSWKYSDKYSPALVISNATWTYQYVLYQSGCFGTKSSYTNGLNTVYPKPIYNKTYPNTNNGSLSLNPNVNNGYWTAKSPTGTLKYFATAIKINYTIPVTYAGLGHSTWNLVE